MMEIKHKNMPLLLLLLNVLLIFLLSETKGQNLSESSVRGGFVVPEYDAKNRKRSVLYGDEALFLSNRIYLIKGLKIEVFNEEEKTIWTVNAPRCYFNYNNRTAFSDGELRLNSEDGQLSISGNGFEWRQSDSSLTISNNILTKVRILSRATNAPKGTIRQEFEITANKFQFKSRAFEAEYKGNVRIKEIANSQKKSNFMNFQCDELLIRFVERLGDVQEIIAKNNVVFDDTENRGVAIKAVYIATNNLLVLEGPASWSTTEAEGTANRIILDRQRDAFIALGNTITRSKTNISFGINALFQSPNTSKSSGGSAEKLMEISAEKIIATKFMDKSVEMRSFNAETNVVVTQGDNFIKTDKLFFSYSTNDASLYCSGNTQWKTPDMIGKAKELHYSKKTTAMSANGNVEIKLELLHVQPAEPQMLNTNKRIVEIYGDTFSYQTTNIFLKNNVKLIDNTFELSCSNLYLNVIPPNKIEKFHASENVKLKQKKADKNYWILSSKYLDGESSKNMSGIENIHALVDVTATYNTKLTNNIEYEKMRLNCYEAHFSLNPLSNIVKTIVMSNDVVIIQNDIQTNLATLPNFKLQCDILTVEMDETGEFIKSGNARERVVLEKMPPKTDSVNQPIVLRSESLKIVMKPNTNLVDYLEATQTALIEYGDNYAIAKKAIYYSTNELIELRGNPRLNLSPEMFKKMSVRPSKALNEKNTNENSKSVSKTSTTMPGLKTVEVTGAETLMWFMKDNRFQAVGPYKLNISLSSTNTGKSGIFNIKND